MLRRIARHRDRPRARRRRRVVLDRQAARRWRWSANRAAASRRSARRSCGCSTSPAARSCSRAGASTTSPRASVRPLRRAVQVVFQDPFSSLNPRMRVRDILAEPIRNFGLAKTPAEIEARVAALLDKVRLPRDAAGRWPHEFSGGQRQRIGIARALAVRARAHHLRRGGLGAGRLGQGADRQPAAGPAAGAGPRPAVHQPRPRHRRAHRPSRGRHVSGPHRRAGRQAHAVLRARSIPTRRRCCPPCRCRTRTAQSRRIILQGDVPSPIKPPPGLSFPRPLPLRRAALPRRGAGDAAGGAGPYGGLPSARGAAGCVTARRGSELVAMDAGLVRSIAWPVFSPSVRRSWARSSAPTVAPAWSGA